MVKSPALCFFSRSYHIFYFFVTVGLRAWNESESYLRQSQLAMIPLQLYLQIIMALIFGFVYTYLMYGSILNAGLIIFPKPARNPFPEEM